MKVILVYDIDTTEKEGQKRLNKIRKVADKYLHHVQKSVFEGYITISNLEKLKQETVRLIDKSKDSLILYILEKDANYRREILSGGKDPTDNMI